MEERALQEGHGVAPVRVAGGQLGLQMFASCPGCRLLGNKARLVLTLMAFSVFLSTKMKVYSGAFRSY